MLVFVYGTLLRGESNHGLLADARRIGDWVTPPRFTLYDVGPFPVLCDRGMTRVRGEVYQVDGARMRRLDALEDYPHHYDRDRIVTPWGPAWYYFQHRRPPGARVIPTGDWRCR